MQLDAKAVSSNGLHHNVKLFTPKSMQNFSLGCLQLQVMHSHHAFELAKHMMCKVFSYTLLSCVQYCCQICVSCLVHKIVIAMGVNGQS